MASASSNSGTKISTRASLPKTTYTAKVPTNTTTEMSLKACSKGAKDRVQGHSQEQTADCKSASGSMINSRYDARIY